MKPLAKTSRFYDSVCSTVKGRYIERDYLSHGVQESFRQDPELAQQEGRLKLHSILCQDSTPSDRFALSV